jgi:hypothetical protein
MNAVVGISVESCGEGSMRVVLMGVEFAPVAGVAGGATEYLASIACLKVSFPKRHNRDLSGKAKYCPSRIILPALRYLPAVGHARITCDPPQKKHVAFG